MKNLGNSGIEISALGLGCMGMTHAYGAPSDETEMIKRIHSAIGMGITFFDTTECYIAEVNGQTLYNEELVGKALKFCRDKVVIATKFGVRHNADSSLSMDSRPETIRKSVEGSLKRLDTDSIRSKAPSFNVSVVNCTTTEKSKWNPSPIEAGDILI